MTGRLDADILNRLIVKIYDAALAPALWEDFMAAGRTVFRSTGSSFVQFDILHPELSYVDLHGVDPSLQVEMLKRPETEDYWYLHVKELPSGSVVTGSEIISRPLMHEMRFYQEVANQVNREYLLACVIHNAPDSLCWLSFLRGRECEDFDVADKRVMNLLLPHLQKAYHLQYDLALGGPFKQTSETTHYGIVVLDRTRSVVFASDKASQFFRENDGLSLRQGRLKLVNGSEQAKLDHILDTFLARETASEGAMVLAVTRPSRRLAYQIVIHRLTPESRVPGWIEKAAFLLRIHDPTSLVNISPECIRATYGTTPAETQICMMLFEGHSLQEVAERLKISRNTAKTHLKKIFEKCQVSSQSQLVRLLALGLR